MIIKTAPDEIIDFFSDASNYKEECSSVAFPENKDDVIQLINEANKEKYNVSISGGGTGLTGGRTNKGGRVISTIKLNKISDFNLKEKTIRVEAGVLLKDLQKFLSDTPFFYPPDPTETSASLGGTIATNASGSRTFKYGSTRNWIDEIDIVLPNGKSLMIKRGLYFSDRNLFNVEIDNQKINLSIPDTRKPISKNSAGYQTYPGMDLIDLFIGSEGTLGIVMSAKLKLFIQPQHFFSFVIFFDKELDALNFISEARELSYDKNCNHSASAIEYFDNNALKLLKTKFHEINPDAGAAVWLEQDSKSEQEFLNLWLPILYKHNADESNIWFAVTEQEKEKIISIRHSVSNLVNEFVAQKGFRKLGTDTAVPDRELINYYYFSKNLVEKEKIDYVIYGHIGNSHLHLNMLPKNEEEFERGQKIYYALCYEAAKLGGTVSAEHGIGKTKRHLLNLMYDDITMEQMRSIKKYFDPNLVLNKDLIFNNL